jgi:hypothetical protein
MLKIPILKFPATPTSVPQSHSHQYRFLFLSLLLVVLWLISRCRNQTCSYRKLEEWGIYLVIYDRPEVVWKSERTREPPRARSRRLWRNRPFKVQAPENGVKWLKTKFKNGYRNGNHNYLIGCAMPCSWTTENSKAPQIICITTPSEQGKRISKK